MNTYCYIIFSKSLNRFYTGVCQDDLDERTRKHNAHEYGNHRFTAAANDWELYLKIPGKDYAHAVRMERHIKAMKISQYIRNLNQYQELIEKLILITSN